MSDPSGTGFGADVTASDGDGGWSAPRIYGAPMPVPGDGSSLAVATAQADGRVHEAWSPPIYHGPRRHRPRTDFGTPPSGTEQAVTGLATGTVAQSAGPVIDENPATTPDASSDAAPDAASVAFDAVPEPSLMASSRTMAIASLASRATGFLRNIAIAAAVGSGLHSAGDAYGLANTLPNMVYELLLGGVLTSVIIPVLVKAQQDDRDRGVAYTQRLLSIAVAGLGAGTLVAVVAAPWLIDVFGGNAQDRPTATLFATLLLPEIFFYGLGAMFAAILNSRHVFGWPAWAPVMNNVITIAAAALFALVPGHGGTLTTESITDTQILVLGVGTTLGIVAQSLILIIPLRRTGFRWRWRFRASPNEVGRIAEFRTLTLWVLGYVAVSQLGVVAINRVANSHGAVQIFAQADLLFQVPYGIVGVSLLTALMPRMSRAAARGNTAEVLDDLRLGARLSAVALIPITAGLIVLGPSFTSAILLGRFKADDARLTGIALAAGAFGLLPFAFVMLQQRVFYAMRDARTPTFINIAMVGTKIVALVIAAATLSDRGVVIALTVSTSLSYVAGCIVGHFLLRRKFGRLGLMPVARTVGWISIAAVAGGAVALAVVLVGNATMGIGRVSGLIEFLVGGTLGLAVMGGVALRLPLPEVREILDAVRGRTPRRDDNMDEPVDRTDVPAE
ncbi:murein biosynthesis integral membrane protein MurJ [Jatrophihabitans sp. DSM 45814]